MEKTARFDSQAKGGNIPVNTEKRAAFYIILVVVPVLAALAAAEIYVRVTSPYGYVTPELLRSRDLQYGPALFARTVFPRKEQRVVDVHGKLAFSINALGYRGPMFEPVKPPDVVRIMVYGGSAAFDSGNVEGHDWPRLVEKRLHESGKDKVEVINAATPGHASFDSVGKLFSEGHVYSPDYVLLYSVWNDIKDFKATEPLLRLHEPTQGTESDPRTTYQNFLDRWLSETSQVYVRVRERYFIWKYRIGAEGSLPEGSYASTLSDAALRQYKMNIETFVDVAKNAGATPVLITEAHLATRNTTDADKKRISYEMVLLTHDALCDAYDAADRILREVSSEKGVPLIDASNVLSGRSEFFSDHVHLTERGSIALADVISTSMAPLLSKPAAGGSTPDSSEAKHRFAVGKRGIN